MCWHSVVLTIYSGAEEGFKNGEAGYSSVSEAGETHRKVPNKSVGIRVLFFFSFNFSKILLLLLFVAVVLGPAAEAVDNFPTLFSIFFKLFPCVCALIGRGRRPIRTQPPRRWEWCHRSGIRFNQCHFFHLQAVRDAFHRCRALLKLCHCHVQPDHRPVISKECPDRWEKANFRLTNSNIKIILALNKDNQDYLHNLYFRYIWNCRHCNEGIQWGRSRKWK